MAFAIAHPLEHRVLRLFDRFGRQSLDIQPDDTDPALGPLNVGWYSPASFGKE